MKDFMQDFELIFFQRVKSYKTSFTEISIINDRLSEEKDALWHNAFFDKITKQQIQENCDKVKALKIELAETEKKLNDKLNAILSNDRVREKIGKESLQEELRNLKIEQRSLKKENKEFEKIINSSKTLQGNNNFFKLSE